jgi:MFS family permease
LPAPAVIATRSGATVVNPLRHLRRFLAQPRLRLAWLLAFARAGWWQMFFVYGPIFVVTAGLGQEAAGAMISIGAGALLLVPVWGWFGRRYGLRRLLLVGYSLTGLLTLAVAALADLPMTGVAVLVVAVFTASLIDGAGNVPFLRSVRVWERPEMTGVFTTYRQMAQFAPPGFFAILLKMFELPAVFVASGIGMLILAGFTRYLPRRM